MSASRALTIALLAGGLTWGLARGSATQAGERKPGARLVRASGGGRLRGQRTAYALQPAIGRITARTLDGLATVPFDLTFLIDGVARALPLGRLDPLPSTYALGTTFTLDLGDAQPTATLEFRLDTASEALMVDLSIADGASLGAHVVALQIDLASEEGAAFVTGTGEIADGAQVSGRAVVVDGDPHPFGVVSSQGALAIQTRVEGASVAPRPDRAPPLRISASSPPVGGAGAAGVVSTDLRVALGGASGQLWRALYHLGRIPTAKVAGVVTGAHGRARIFGLDAEGAPQLRAIAAADGRFDLDVPPSIVQWYAALDATRTSAPTMFAPGTGYDLRLDVSPGGELRVRILDGDTGLPITARLLVHGIDGTLDPSFGPDYRATGAGPIIDALRGEVTTPLPAGRYRVAATKGIEWSVDAKVIEIAGGRSVSVDLSPRHVVPTPGMIGCDLHVHARPSFDTPVSVEDRVLSLVAAGIDFAVPTEHNIVGDYGPALATLNLAGELESVHGVEVTTYSPRLGHFGLFPYPLGTTVPPYRHSSVRAVFAAAHRGDPSRILQVNHPRLPKGIGYFELFGFNPTAPHPPGNMRTDFDSIEVYNGYDLPFPARVDAVLRDYYALLNLGHRYVATGSSDSHRIQYQWAGYPRTFVDVGDAAERTEPLDTALLVSQLKKGHAIVTSGPIIELMANGAKPGDDLDLPAGARLRAHVVVRAAPWVDVSSLEIIVGGRIARALDVPSRPTQLGLERGTREEAFARTVRFDSEVEIPIGETSTWFIVIARGARRMDDVLPFMPVPPFALTNPIWITRSGTTGDSVPAHENP